VLAAAVPALLALLSGRYPLHGPAARVTWLVWIFLLLSSLSGLFMPPDSPLEIPASILLLAIALVTLVMAIGLLRQRAVRSK